MGDERYDYEFELDNRLLESLSLRHVVLLDTSVWVRLSDRQDKLATSVVEKLLRLKNAEKIFCPLAAPTIWELRKQVGGSLVRTAGLMEELSENVTFRSVDQIFDMEVKSFLDYLLTGEFKPLSLAHLFGPIMSYLAPGYRLVGVDSSIPSHTISLLHANVKSLRLSALIKKLGDSSSPSFPGGYDMTSVAKSRRAIVGSSIDLARRVEIEEVAKRIVVPLINKNRSKMRFADQLRIVAGFDSLPRSRRYRSAIEYILKFMPALAAYVEILTFSGLDVTRKTSQNDFFDRELLIYAMSYSGTFSAVDRWIASIVSLSRKGGFSAIYAFSGSLKELDQRLDQIY